MGERPPPPRQMIGTPPPPGAREPTPLPLGPPHKHGLSPPQPAQPARVPSLSFLHRQSVQELVSHQTSIGELPTPDGGGPHPRPRPPPPPTDPPTALLLGHPEHLTEMEDMSREGEEANQRELQAFAAAARTIDPNGLPPAEQGDREGPLFETESAPAELECG